MSQVAAKAFNRLRYSNPGAIRDLAAGDFNSAPGDAGMGSPA